MSIHPTISELARDRRDAAAALVGRRVRWANETTSQSMRVVRVAYDGMVEIEGYGGLFAPHLFSVAEPGVVLPGGDDY